MIADGGTRSLFDRMEKHSTPLSQFVKGKIYRGIVTGLNEAFLINDTQRRLLSASLGKRKEVIQPFLVGKDIRRWKVSNQQRSILYMNHDIDTRGLEAVLQHLKPFRTQLEARATNQAWYELQQPQQAYVSVFKAPKLVFPDISKVPRFAVDNSGAFVDCTAFVIPNDDLFLLGVLNSLPVHFYFLHVGATVRGGYLRFKRQYVEQIPIPTATGVQKARLEKLVSECSTASQDDLEDIDHRINEQVAELYELKLDDVLCHMSE